MPVRTLSPSFRHRPPGHVGPAAWFTGPLAQILHHHSADHTSWGRQEGLAVCHAGAAPYRLSDHSTAGTPQASARYVCCPANVPVRALHARVHFRVVGCTHDGCGRRALSTSYFPLLSLAASCQTSAVVACAAPPYALRLVACTDWWRWTRSWASQEGQQHLATGKRRTQRWGASG